MLSIGLCDVFSEDRLAITQPYWGVHVWLMLFLCYRNQICLAQSDLIKPGLRFYRYFPFLKQFSV
jgi:hypothetical protein